MTRKQPNMTEKLAAAYLHLVEFVDGKWRRVVDREHAKNMTADQIVSLFEVDHWPLSVKLGGTNHPTNLSPRLIMEHREKTHKHDAKVHAKIRRAEKKKAKEQEALAAAHDVLGVTAEDAIDVDVPVTMKPRSRWPKPTKEQKEANKAYRELVYAERKRKRKAKMPGSKMRHKPEGAKYNSSQGRDVRDDP